MQGGVEREGESENPALCLVARRGPARRGEALLRGPRPPLALVSPSPLATSKRAGGATLLRSLSLSKEKGRGRGRRTPRPVASSFSPKGDGGRRPGKCMLDEGGRPASSLFSLPLFLSLPSSFTHTLLGKRDVFWGRRRREKMKDR